MLQLLLRMFDWLMALDLTRAEWKSSTKAAGAQSVMTVGIYVLDKLSAGVSDTKVSKPCTRELTLDKVTKNLVVSLKPEVGFL